MSDDLAGQIPSEVAIAQDSSLALMGLIPRGYNTTSAVLDSLGQSVNGVYLVREKVVAIHSNMGVNGTSETLIHELTHVAQDSLYDLGSRLKYSAFRADGIAGLHALAEGEATRIQIEIGSIDSSVSSVSEEEVIRQLRSSLNGIDVPSIVRRSLIAPYVDGYRFISYLVRLGGWPLVDKVWQRGLSNTSEVLHPERWVNATGPVLRLDDPKEPRPDVEDVVLANATLKLRESWGEQGLRIVLEENLPESVAARLASGWVWDSFWFLTDERQERFAWHIRLQSNEQAREVALSLSEQFFGDHHVERGCRDREGGTLALHVTRQDIVVTASAELDTTSSTRWARSCTALIQWTTRIARSL